MSAKTQLIEAFGAIKSDQDLWAFETRFGLTTSGIAQPVQPTQVFSVKGGVVDGMAIQVRHRWYDPSGPFQNLPDITKAELAIDGVQAAAVSYEDK